MLVDEESIFSLFHDDIGIVKLTHHPPSLHGRQLQSGLLRLFHRHGVRELLFLYWQRLHARQGLGSCGRQRCFGFRQHDGLPQGRNSPLQLGYGGGSGLLFGLGRILQNGREGLIFLRSHGAEEGFFLLRCLCLADRLLLYGQLSPGRGRHSGFRLLFELDLGPVYLLVQSAQNAVVDAVEDSLFREELNFRLGGVDVYIHGICRHIQMQHTGGEFAHHDLIAVGFLQGGHHEAGFNRAAVDEESLQTAAGPGIRRLADEAGEGVTLPPGADLHHLGAVSSVDAVNSVPQISGAGGGENLLSVPQEPEGHLRMGKGLLLHSSSHTASLHRVGFHEFHPGGGVEEQVSYDDGGAVGAACLGFFNDLTGLQPKAGAAEAAGSLGQQVNAADGGDGGQGLTAEAQCADGGQVFRTPELGSGMTEESGSGILRLHTAAVVGQAQEGHAAVPDLQGHLGGSGINGIFQKFLDNAGRPFHNLTGGDQVGNVLGKLCDFGHDITSKSRWRWRSPEHGSRWGRRWYRTWCNSRRGTVLRAYTAKSTGSAAMVYSCGCNR